MKKTKAIKWLEEIQAGKGSDRDNFPEQLRASLAREYWDDARFTLGWEYGILQALLIIYQIKPGDLKS